MITFHLFAYIIMCKWSASYAPYFYPEFNVYIESTVSIRKKATTSRGATRHAGNKTMAKRQTNLATLLEEGNKKYVVYGIACFMCVGAGAYIGHNSREEIFEPSSATSSSADSYIDKPLEIKYAYFGAPAIHMPSEQSVSRTAQIIEGTVPNEVANGNSLAQQTLAQPSAPIVAIEEITNSMALENTAAIIPPQVSNKPDGTNLATISKGDSFSTIGQSYGLSVREAANIMQDELASKYLKTIYPGKQITFKSNLEEKVEQIIYVIDDSHTLILDRVGEAKFAATLDEVALERRIMVNMGVVENSLFLSAAEAGVSNRHIMQMVDIFRWDVDFAMDVQPNDTFKMVYEAFYKGEQLVRTGRLLGVEFKGRSTHQALYFEDSDNEGAYYTARGKQLEKQFLRNPVDTVRITSHFNPKRKHPVLNTIKAHKGVDYGAPIGTPIKATADGIVKTSGRRGSFGFAVELQHGKRYTTLYAHMNKIHKNTTAGKKVKQGQVIGYVGKTGRVTGAHLHYEFRVKGVHVNPQTVKFAGAGMLPDDELRQFRTATTPIMQQLTNLKPHRFALAQ